jgi:uncharacterized membrane protein
MGWMDLLKNKPQILFAILFLLFGLLYVFLTPPIYVADESAHFYRAYQVSEGNFVPENVGNESGGKIPKSLSDFVGLNVIESTQKFNFAQTFSKSLKLDLNPSQRLNLEFTNVAIYPTANYLPQAIGIDIGRIFTSKVIVLFYLARIVNLLFLCACLFWAIRTMPFGKFALMIIGLLPMVLYAGSSLSADTFVIASVSLFVAYLLKLINQKEIALKGWLIIAAMAGMVTMSKQTYFVLAMAILALPFRSRVFIKADFKKATLALLVPVFLLGGWMLLINGLNNQPVNLQHAVNIYADPGAQKQFIVSHPLSFIKLLIGGIADSTLIPGMLGVMGVNDLPMPAWSLFVLFLVVFLSFGTLLERAEKYNKPNKFVSMVIFTVVALNILLILTGLYIFWSTLKQDFISGVRGRYFIPPLIMLIPVLLMRFKHTIKPQVLLAVHFIVLLTSVWALINRFYI